GPRSVRGGGAAFASLARLATFAASTPAAATSTPLAVFITAFGLLTRSAGADTRLVVVGVLAGDRLVVFLVLFVFLDRLVVIAVIDHGFVGGGGRDDGRMLGAGLHRGPLDQALGVRHVVIDDHGDEEAQGGVQPRQVGALFVENVEAHRAGDLQ